MKALVKSKAAPGLWLEETPVPQVGLNDVLIRVERTGICGTDLHIYDWDAWAQKTVPTPLIIGHEFVGEVVEVGSNVADFFPGDMVSGEGHVVCGRCRNCMAGRRHLCRDTSVSGCAPGQGKNPDAGLGRPFHRRPGLRHPDVRRAERGTGSIGLSHAFRTSGLPEDTLFMACGAALRLSPAPIDRRRPA